MDAVSVAAAAAAVHGGDGEKHAHLIGCPFFWCCLKPLQLPLEPLLGSRVLAPRFGGALKLEVSNYHRRSRDPLHGGERHLLTR